MTTSLQFGQCRTGALARLWFILGQRIGFIAVPVITPALREVLEELRTEQRKVASIGGKVFTRNGRPRSYRTAFEEAREKTGIEDITLHDYRYTAITRWAMAGIP